MLRYNHGEVVKIIYNSYLGFDKRTRPCIFRLKVAYALYKIIRSRKEWMSKTFKGFLKLVCSPFTHGYLSM